MYKTDSDYALNKHSQNIVYRQADGSRVKIKPEDCPDFDRWKAFSDGDFKELDRQDQIEAQGRVSFNDLTDAGVEPPHSVEEAAELGEPPPTEPEARTMENAMAILACLTETQRRRYLLYNRDGLTIRQIASQEQVAAMVVQHSIEAAKKKICESSSRNLKNGVTKPPKNDA